MYMYIILRMKNIEISAILQ